MSSRDTAASVRGKAKKAIKQAVSREDKSDVRAVGDGRVSTLPNDAMWKNEAARVKYYQDGVIHADTLPGQGPDAGQFTGPNYSATYNRPSEYDKIISIKQDLAAAAAGGESPFGQITMSDRDVEWILEKRATVEERLRDEWFNELFDTRDPVQLKMARELNPSFFERQDRDFKLNMELCEKMYKINTRGLQTPDDIDFMYAVNTGQVELPGPNFWNPDPQGVGAEEGNFQRGLFSPGGIPTEAAKPFRRGRSGRGLFQRGTGDNHDFGARIGQMFGGPNAFAALQGRQNAMAAGLGNWQRAPARGGGRQLPG